ncbi:MAG: adenosylmethionine--8-amino-7-oxononanoate transaminase [Timaviella obliquedivisa GSE-PSE-MK23-08B]|jgi:adenosylmethionine-8-amino-7-oxononanoate aminotransferase|nr:adenosylmethionine--8-amino-7-oxononanoate transaminase [Timaviella obliquedivisa GSE-PSE-MK23-08B]
MSHPNIWYPFAQAKTELAPIKIKSAQGIWLELEDGSKIMDCISSWWVNLHGHAHPKIAEAIYKQAQQLEHVIFAGFTHDPAEQLAEALIAKLPPGFSRVFFSDNGSTAVEVALKMAYQYWVNHNQKRQTFLAFEGSYHGDTIGAMSVGGRSLFSDVYRSLLFDVEYLPFPDTYFGDTLIEEKEERILEQLRGKINHSPEQYAGIIVEPLVQGAGGMRMCRPEFIQNLRKIADEFNTLLIFDEVMVGFGRTGDWFACRKANVTPDIICLSKGLTGGTLPLSVTVCSEKIYDAFYSDDPLKALYHGHSYTANPLGCAVALASMELLIENETAFRQMEQLHWTHLQPLLDHPKLERLRVMGTIAAIDIISEQPGYLNPISLHIRQQAIAHKLLLRPLGNVLYLLPPYCITADELALAYQGITAILETV